MKSKAQPQVVAQIERITDILIPESAHLVVTDGLHCGHEPTGGQVVDQIDAFPLDRVKTYRMHPEAVKAQKRYLGTRELGSKFVLNKLSGTPIDELDPEQRAALGFMKGMSEEGWQYWLGIDIHTSNLPNSNCLVVGDEGTPLSAFGVAGVLGLTNVLVLEKYPFFNYFDKFISVETQLAPGKNSLSDPLVWYQHIRTIRDMGYYAMEKLGQEILGDLKYFVQIELTRLDKNGHVDPAAIKLIEKLEKIEPPEQWFEPIRSLPAFLERLIPPGHQVYAGSWDDQNNSPEMPELLGYREDGRPRRTVFGSFMLEISPPQILMN